TGCGIPDGTGASFRLLPAPALDISLDPNPACIGSPVVFDAPVAGAPGPFVWDWDFGDATAGAGEMPTHVYTSSGTFLVAVTVTDSSTGCSARAVRAIA